MREIEGEKRTPEREKESLDHNGSLNVSLSLSGCHYVGQSANNINNKGHKRIHTQRTFKYSISCPLPFLIAGVTLFPSIRYVNSLFEVSLERERFYSLETNVNINMILMQWTVPFVASITIHIHKLLLFVIAKTWDGKRKTIRGSGHLEIVDIWTHRNDKPTNNPFKKKLSNLT